MVKDFLGIIKKPIDAVEKKFGGNVKKAFIIFGILIGIYFLADFISMMYGSMKGFDGKLHFEALKNINYFKYILNFILREVFFFGSIAAALFVYTSISKKEFKLIDVLSIIIVSYTFYYLIEAALGILFMFDFMNIKFLITLKSIISTTAFYYAIALLVISIQKTYDAKINDKSFINLAIMFATMTAIYQLLSLTL